MGQVCKPARSSAKPPKLRATSIVFPHKFYSFGDVFVCLGYNDTILEKLALVSNGGDQKYTDLEVKVHYFIQVNAYNTWLIPLLSFSVQVINSDKFPSQKKRAAIICCNGPLLAGY